ncbi:hypothetical protein ABW20_dc0104256 [Dactylellina cionopaga]|nr:hypothetical protein ABW20_dc0104256 [Dactylellina cionopaga]
MAQPRDAGSISGHSGSPLDSKLSFYQMLGTQHKRPLTGDGSIEGNKSQDFENTNSASVSVPAANSSTHSLGTLGEDETLTKIDLVSYLPRIPATSTTASEEERLAKWGPSIGPPKGGSTCRNPHSYEILEAYFEETDHPMFNVTESTRRAGKIPHLLS